MEVGISLGSNLGDRLDNLEQARAGLAGLHRGEVVACSRAYETEPVGVKAEYADLRYLNAVVILTTQAPLEVFARRIRVLETTLGRTRTEDRYAPRTVDLDIIYADDFADAARKAVAALGGAS